MLIKATFQTLLMTSVIMHGQVMAWECSSLEKTALFEEQFSVGNPYPERIDLLLIKTPLEIQEVVLDSINFVKRMPEKEQSDAKPWAVGIKADYWEEDAVAQTSIILSQEEKPLWEIHVIYSVERPYPDACSFRFIHVL